jgi:hypothetical protein
MHVVFLSTKQKVVFTSKVQLCRPRISKEPGHIHIERSGTEMNTRISILSYIRDSGSIDMLHKITSHDSKRKHPGSFHSFIRLVPKSNPDPLPWTYSTTLNAKAAVSPYPGRHPIIMKARTLQKPNKKDIYSSWLGVFPPLGAVFFGRRFWWIFGRTPPCAIVTWPRSLFNSSSLRMASWRWRGMIRVFLLSRAALPANSRISAARYSRTAAK